MMQTHGKHGNIYIGAKLLIFKETDPLAVIYVVSEHTQTESDFRLY